MLKQKTKREAIASSILWFYFLFFDLFWFFVGYLYVLAVFPPFTFS